MPKVEIISASIQALCSHRHPNYYMLEHLTLRNEAPSGLIIGATAHRCIDACLYDSLSLSSFLTISLFITRAP